MGELHDRIVAIPHFNGVYTRRIGHALAASAGNRICNPEPERVT
jgi:hypothetical protein